MDVASERNRRIQIHRRHGIAERRCLQFRHHEIHAMFEELIHRPWSTARWNPPVDVREDKDSFLIEMDLPGVKAEDIQVVVEGKTISIDGRRQLGQCDAATTHLCERPDGRFTRVFEFEGQIDNDQIESRWQDGVLTVTVPKTKTKG